MTPLGSFAQSDSLSEQRDLLTVDDLVDLDDPDEMQVYAASRSSQKVQDLPLSLFVVTRDEILRNGYFTLGDVLKSVPGIKVSQPGGADLGETFLMRGLIGNSYSKILINDIPIAPSVLGGVPISGQLPIRQAERIEILFGPASSVYGADAMAGVINIVTLDSDKSHYAQGEIALGTNGLRHGNFLAGGKYGKNKNILKYSIYGNLTERGHANVVHTENNVYNPLARFMVRPEDIPNHPEFMEMFYPPLYEGTLTHPVINDLPQDSWSIGTRLQLRGFTFSYDQLVRHDHSSMGRSSFFFKYAIPDDQLGERIQRSTLSYEKIGKRFTTTSNLSYLHYRMDNRSAFRVNFPVGSDGKAYQYAGSDDIYVEQLVTYNPNPNIEILGGANFQYSGQLPGTNNFDQPFDPNDYKVFGTSSPEPFPPLGVLGEPTLISNFAAFGQLYATYGKLTLLGGIRADRNSLFGVSVNPRISGLIKFRRSSLHMGYGSGFRPPSLYELYTNAVFSLFVGDSLMLMNRPVNLEPEKFRSVEMGYKHKFSDKLALEVSVYGNLRDNLARITDPFSDSSGVNIGDLLPSFNSDSAFVILLGANAHLRFRDILEPLNMSGNLSLTFTQGQEKLPDSLGSTGPAERINAIRMSPAFIGQLNLTMYPAKNFFIQTQHVVMSNWLARHTPTQSAYESGRFTIDGYYVLDLAAGYDLGKFFRASLIVTNVFGNEFGGIGVTGLQQNLPYNPQYLRNIRFMLSYRFD